MADFPQFELAGPPCESEGCTGVLIPYVSLKRPQDCWEQCSKCHRQFYRMPAQEAVGAVLRTLNRILEGQKLD